MNTVSPAHPPIDTIVYSRDGRRAKYVCSVIKKYGVDHFVRPEVEFGLPDGEVESSFEGSAVWHEFFLAPPRAVIDKEIEALEEKATALRAEVYRLDREKSEVEQDVIARKARLSKHAQLKQLDDFITKGIACYVTDNGYGELHILDFGNSHAEYGDRDTFRLLSLFGNSKGQLDWKLNRYGDGSGNYTDCIPCVSKEDAKAAIAERLNVRWEMWRNGTKTNHLYHLSAYVKAAVAHGLPVPEDVAAQIAKDEEETKLKNLERAQKAFAEAQAALMKAEEGVLSRMGVPAKPVPCAPAPKSP